MIRPNKCIIVHLMSLTNLYMALLYEVFVLFLWKTTWWNCNQQWKQTGIIITFFDSCTHDWPMWSEEGVDSMRVLMMSRNMSWCKICCNFLKIASFFKNHLSLFDFALIFMVTKSWRDGLIVTQLRIFFIEL